MITSLNRKRRLQLERVKKLTSYYTTMVANLYASRVRRLRAKVFVIWACDT